MQPGLDSLAQNLIDGKRALFITGAGLSVASGISPYRATKDAIWNNYLTDWGTRGKFLEDPLAWWNTFWLRTHEKPEFLHAKPNVGHHAIGHITQRCNTRIITQNIDGLHLLTLNNPNRLIEIHGRLGLYKCIHEGCKYEMEHTISGIDLNDYAVEGTALEDGDLLLQSVPLCPSCSHPIMPQSLFFDEMYASHEFFKYDMAQEWMKQAEVFIFVGTSFSVGITAEALEVARKAKKLIYNFNIFAEKFDSPAFSIVGKAEETLPALYNRMLALAGKPRMYFYPIPSVNNNEEQGTRYSLPPRMLEVGLAKSIYRRSELHYDADEMIVQ